MADFVETTGRIHLEQLELSARVGVSAEERSQPQRLSVNITVWPAAPFEQLKDDIEQTVDYVKLSRAADEFVAGREWKLIETIAADLASHILQTFPVQIVELEVRKFVLPNAAYVSAMMRKTSTG